MEALLICIFQLILATCQLIVGIIITLTGLMGTAFWLLVLFVFVVGPTVFIISLF